VEHEKLWTKEFILDTLVNFLIYIIYYMLMVIIASEAIKTLNASMSEAGLASGIFILGTLLARMVAGHSIELYGRKFMLYAGIIFYLATTLLYFFVDSLSMLYIVRCLNGIGYGIASTATSTIVSSIIPVTRRGEGINYYALSMSLAAAIGPFLGMLMQHTMTFNYIIDFCVAMLVVCLVLALVAALSVPVVRVTERMRLEREAALLASDFRYLQEVSRTERTTDGKGEWKDVHGATLPAGPVTFYTEAIAPIPVATTIMARRA